MAMSKKENVVKLLEERLDALRLLETSFVGPNGPTTHFLLTYTPPELPCAEEEYQLTRRQVQEFFGLCSVVVDIAKGKVEPAPTEKASASHLNAAMRPLGREGEVCMASVQQQETLADVVKYIRGDAKDLRDGTLVFPPGPDKLDWLADRIEAATARERNRQHEPMCNWSVRDALALANTLANHGLRDGNADAASSCIYSLCRILSSPGNAAALREALDGVLSALEDAGFHPFVYGDPLAEAVIKARAALSVPAQNCDRLRDIVRELADEFEQLEEVDLVCNTDRHGRIEALFREAREALGEGLKEGGAQ